MNKGPLSPHEIEALARISVLEYLVAQLFNMQYRARDLPLRKQKEDHRKAKAIFKRQTFPAFDAAQSDQLAAEMDTALESDLELIEQLFELYSKANARQKPSN